MRAHRNGRARIWLLDLLLEPPDQPLLYPDSETVRCQTRSACWSMSFFLALAEKLGPLTWETTRLLTKPVPGYPRQVCPPRPLA